MIFGRMYKKFTILVPVELRHPRQISHTMLQYSFHKHLANVDPNATQFLELKSQQLAHYCYLRSGQFWRYPYPMSTQKMRIKFESVTFSTQIMYLNCSVEELNWFIVAAFPDYSAGNKNNTIVVDTHNFILWKIKQI